MIPAFKRQRSLISPLAAIRQHPNQATHIRRLITVPIAHRQTRQARVSLRSSIGSGNVYQRRTLATAVEHNATQVSKPWPLDNSRQMLLITSLCIALIALYFYRSTPDYISPYPATLPSDIMDSSYSNPLFKTPSIPKAPAGKPVELILPPTEDRPHRYFTLQNGLEVIVVSDPGADKAAASMDVGVGHLSDPDDLPGCAHFCEHLLFMGTNTFPGENSYQQYLSSHNGHSNAYTAMTSTVYFFDVASDALEGALDRFSGFFIEPLFNEDCTEREIKAVDSEHKKNIQSDMWRFFQMEKHIWKEDHAYHKFGTGNYESLWSKPKSEGRDPRQQLIDWWKKYYCARRMKLVVVGKEDLDTLEGWVKDRFEKVPIRTANVTQEVGIEGVRIAWPENPVGAEQMGVITFTRPVQDSRGLEITFPFPDLDHLYQSKPGHYVTHFIGHEGRGSILSYLKKKGWVNYLRAGQSHGAAGFDFMKITVDLTPTGLENWQEVTTTIFKYISLLRSSPPSSEVFNEIKAIAEISFKFAEKTKNGRYATALSNWMQRPLPREKIVSGGGLLEDFRPDEVAAVLQLLDPRRATVGITTRELPKDVDGSFNRNEPIYGTEYTQRPIPERILKEALSGSAIPELALPGKNEFIPERLDVEKFDVKQPSLRPSLVKSNELSRLFYKRDDQFWLPKANVDILLHSPILNNTPRNAVLARIFCDLYRDSITEDVYDADLAELSYHLYYAGESIAISAGGFSDKLAVLLETMLVKLAKFDVDMDRWGGVVEEIRLAWKNFPLGDPYKQASYWSGYVTSQVSWTQTEKLRELEVIKPEDVKAYAKEVLSRLYIETLIHGNTSPEGAVEIQSMVEKVLHPRPLAEAEKNNIRSLMLPRGSEHVWAIDVPNKAEVNSAVIYALQVGDIADQHLRATLQLFAQISNEPTFDRLRTKEQLGYIVDSSATHSVGVMGFRFLVQSEREPAYVESRIDAYLLWLEDYIKEMKDDEFEKHRLALIAKKEEKPKNLGEETRRFWGSITDRYYEFGKRETDVANLRKITKDDILTLLMTHIHPSSPTRAKLSTHLKSQYSGTKFDLDSATPLVEAFTKHAVVVDQAGLQGLMASQPDLDAVKTFAKKAIEATTSLAEEAKAELAKVVAGLKGKQVNANGANGENGEVEGQKEGKNVFITDIHTFKAGLLPSRAPVPLEPLSVVESKL